ncbi:MAG: hypothetical protein A2297_06650 [Elusimicrobia bacterium RIFOXYB2_FULL_48_7]|nr:MAG: hypothetical protein A2297_06650 [Elusimicrobia bacterium RIFOXYB2_FULL_48_7]
MKKQSKKYSRVTLVLFCAAAITSCLLWYMNTRKSTTHHAELIPKKEELLEKSIRTDFLNLKQKFGSLRDYRCVCKTFSADKKKKLLVECVYYFKKPNLVRMEIISDKFKNTTLLFRNNKVRVKPGAALLSLVTTTLDPQNKLVCDLRGHGLDNSSWGWIIDEHMKLLDNMRVIRAEDRQISGRPGVLYELKSKSPGKTHSIDRELLWIDRQENLLVKLKQYDSSGMLLQSLEYRNISINPGLPESLFMNFKEKFKTRR